jgi:hypothetical protein
MTTTTSADPTAADQARDRILLDIEAGTAAGPFRADRGSLRSGYQLPARYADGKFGIFLHWAAPAYPATATSGARGRCTGRGRTAIRCAVSPIRVATGEHVADPVVIKNGRYGAEMLTTGVELYRFPDGPAWTADA